LGRPGSVGPGKVKSAFMQVVQVPIKSSVSAMGQLY
jgi:hypothetical protein